MKPSKNADLRNLTDAELHQQIAENEQALVNMRFGLTIGTLEDTAAMRIIRRDIARIKTILGDRQRENAAS